MKIKTFIIYMVLLAVVGYAGGACLFYFTATPQPESFFDALLTSYAGYGAGLGALVGLVLALTAKPKKEDKKVETTGKTAGGKEVDISFDANWLEPENIKNTSGLISTTWQNLPSLKNTGIVFRNTLEGGKYNIAMKDEYHCMAIGSTASGKTTAVLVPTIRILGHSGEKPNMVITDPKGELYELTSRIMEDEGYRVMVLNLRDPFLSTRWNPMDRAYDIYHKALACRTNIKKYTGRTRPSAAGYKELSGASYNGEWYGFEGTAYPDVTSLTSAVRRQEQILTDLAQNELREICSTIAPLSKNVNDPTWEEGAQNFLYGCALAMLEDSANPELGMTKEKFNFYNLYKIATYKDQDADAPFDTLRKYLLQGRDPAKSNVPGLTSTVVNNAPNTAKSYMGVLNGKISFMSDLGIQSLTSTSDLNFDNFTDKPTVFYLIIPDDREERHNLALLCISQLYKRLVDKANSYSPAKLPKHCYFLLEEFGQLPPIPKFDSMITVARGRNILFELIVQSYTQVETKYGQEAAKTIIGNCNAQIFILTDDTPTQEKFSKMCGDITIYTERENASTTKAEKGEGTSTTKSTQVEKTTRPLIGPYELGQLPRNTVVVKLLRYNPIKTKLTAYYETPFFYKKDVVKEDIPASNFDTEAVYYDINMRNRKILKK